MKYSDKLKQYVGRMGYFGFNEGAYSFSFDDSIPGRAVFKILEVGDDYIVIQHPTHKLAIIPLAMFSLSGA